ncbi:hypothetical protein POM88_005779 [Heracleum sosnowskyi]|uniref:Uncharacterized protein n=1 Tax=Heracleum sosnowskyi TaxID=360622 RepID=A0AAD8J257_9APIA|nr:hypothetical protein POM88_005779 [Heracleum sosnowskyi]
MRHMQTYKGDSKSWNSGFNEEKQNQIRKLRVKYNNAILSSQLNDKRESVMKEGKHLYIQYASWKLVNLVIQSSQPSQEEEQTMPKQGSTREQSGNKKTVTFAKKIDNYI